MTDAADTAPAVDPDVSASRKATRKKWLRRLVVVLAIVGLCWGAWYYLVARNHVSTDNAYVNAQMAQVTPLVAGSAIEVLVEDTQQVRRGTYWSGSIRRMQRLLSPRPRPILPPRAAGSAKRSRPIARFRRRSTAPAPVWCRLRRGCGQHRQS